MFFITIHYIKTENDVSDILNSRCIGYYKDYQNALNTIENNYCDIYEFGHYNYVVIENIPEGLYQYDDNPTWFKVDFDPNKNEYKIKQIESPIKNIFGYSIG